MVDGPVCFGGDGRVRGRARAQRVPGHTVGEREATPRAQGARQSHEDALRQRFERRDCVCTGEHDDSGSGRG